MAWRHGRLSLAAHSLSAHSSLRPWAAPTTAWSSTRTRRPPPRPLRTNAVLQPHPSPTHRARRTWMPSSTTFSLSSSGTGSLCCIWCTSSPSRRSSTVAYCPGTCTLPTSRRSSSARSALRPRGMPLHHAASASSLSMRCGCSGAACGQVPSTDQHRLLAPSYRLAARPTQVARHVPDEEGTAPYLGVQQAVQVDGGRHLLGRHADAGRAVVVRVRPQCQLVRFKGAGGGDGAAASVGVQVLLLHLLDLHQVCATLVGGERRPQVLPLV